jgi:amino acid adenylation domain-containing protein
LPVPDRVLLHQYLIDAAARDGQATAIVEEGRRTSFSALLENAASVAATLRARGLATGDRVALILPKTTEAITAIFGTLLAGGIYVPIQPRWPAERIAATLADCGARVVCTESGISDVESRHARRSGSPDDAALILFTSGSTGQPKGVTLSHRAVAAFVNWSGTEFGIGPGDRVACPSPLSFDLSTFDIFNMARSGATCVLVPERSAWFPRFLTEFLAEERITAWYSVPSVLAGMLNEGGLARRAYPALRLVLFAGEVLASPNAAKLQAALPGVRLCNLYGPTETNVVTWHELPPAFDGTAPIPIGRACPYAHVRLEDGELLVAGDSLMLGYWNRPEETAKAFAEQDGARYYRTGDRVTLAPSGELLFAGRMDRQVKRRGFRIELGEIEAALAGNPALLEAAVVATPDDTSTTLITAFVRLSGGPASVTDVKAHCAQTLPAYMLPDRVVFLEAVPKGSRGKIDYAALRQMALKT